MSQRTALYRHFDVYDRLLYIGISKSALARFGRHLEASHWAQSITRVTVEWLDSREEAMAAELAAIKRERPLHNVIGMVRGPNQDRVVQAVKPDFSVWPIPASQALIAWCWVGLKARPFRGEEDPVRAVAVGHLIWDDMPDWTEGYEATGGASEIYRRDMQPLPQRLNVLSEYYKLVHTYGIDPHVVHRAFLNIAEFQELIKEGGMGPAPGEPGHDPSVGYGRAIHDSTPLHVEKFWHSEHVFPLSAMARPEKDAARRPS